MRTKKELYQIVLDNYKNPDFRGFGFICNNINFCKRRKLITDEEHRMLKEHFVRQKPHTRKHKEFYCKERNIIDGWWDTSDESILIRIKFLEKLIETN